MIDLELGDIRHIPGWAEVMAAAITDAQTGLLDDLQRLPVERNMNDVCAVIAHYMNAEYGWATESNQVIVCYGGVEALHVAIKLAVGELGRVSFLVPSFPYWNICTGAGILCSAIPIDRESSGELVETIVGQTNCRALIISQPHNPFGFVWSASDLQAIEKWAIASNCKLILDVVGACTCADQSWSFGLNPECWWIVDSASKRFGVSGLRLGWVRKPKIQTHSTYLRFGVPVAVSYAVRNIGMKLFERADVLKSLINSEMRMRRKVAKEVLSDHVHVPDAGVFITIKCEPPLNATQLVEKLAGHGVKTPPPSFLVPPTDCEALLDRYLRLSIGSENIERLTIGLSQVRSIVFP